MPTEIRRVCETDIPTTHTGTLEPIQLQTMVLPNMCAHSKTLVTKSGNADKELQCFFISLSCLMSFCRA